MKRAPGKRALSRPKGACGVLCGQNILEYVRHWSTLTLGEMMQSTKFILDWELLSVWSWVLWIWSLQWVPHWNTLNPAEMMQCVRYFWHGELVAAGSWVLRSRNSQPVPHWNVLALDMVRSIRYSWCGELLGAGTFVLIMISEVPLGPCWVVPFVKSGIRTQLQPGQDKKINSLQSGWLRQEADIQLTRN